MQLEYLQGQILNIMGHGEEVVLRLDMDESEMAGDSTLPVLNLRLMLKGQHAEALQSLTNHLHDWVELSFYEDETKFMVVTLDNCSDPEIRLNYVACGFSHEDYTFEELKRKLNDCKLRYSYYVNLYNKESGKWRNVVNGIDGMLRKELDRFERKSEFFGGSEKAGRYEVGRRCCERVINTLNRLQNDGSV